MDPVAEITFDCLPLRSVGRVDIPLDASPAFRERCERLQEALHKYADQNAYYLYNAKCIYRLANSEVDGMLRFNFEGTVLTGPGDRKTEQCDLRIHLDSDTCDGVPDEVVDWFCGVIRKAVLIEFDRYIAAGSLADAIKQVGQLDSIDDLENFAGMHV